MKTRHVETFGAQMKPWVLCICPHWEPYNILARWMPFGGKNNSNRFKKKKCLYIVIKKGEVERVPKTCFEKWVVSSLDAFTHGDVKVWKTENALVWKNIFQNSPIQRRTTLKVQYKYETLKKKFKLKKPPCEPASYAT